MCLVLFNREVDGFLVLQPSSTRHPETNFSIFRREMVGEALKLGKNLTNTGIYINPQLPPSVAERRQFCRSDYMANRNKPGVTAKMSSDRLFINNQLQLNFFSQIR